MEEGTKDFTQIIFVISYLKNIHKKLLYLYTWFCIILQNGCAQEIFQRIKSASRD